MARRKTVTVKDPSIAWAEELWKKLHSNLLNAQTTIVEIIHARAWEPLGYESFSKAWIDRMSGITIAAEIRPHVVYELLAEGLDPSEVSDAVKGIGVDTAQSLNEQRNAGVPPDMASVRRKFKKRPPSTIFVHVGEAAFRRYARIAKAHQVKVEDVSREAIAEMFNKLEGGLE